MQVHITLTDPSGKTYEGQTNLVLTTTRTVRSRRQSAPAAAKTDPLQLEFDLNMRAFAKRYAKGSGRKRYTLLVARLCGGKLGTPVLVKDVEKHWNRMTVPMRGPYNGAHKSRALDEGWIHERGKDSVVLAKGWQDALST